MVLEGSSIKFRNCNLITSCIFFHRLLYPKSIAKSFWVKSITTSFSIFNFFQGLTILLLHYSHEKGYCSPFNLENGFPVSAVFFVLFVLEVTLCPHRHHFDESNNISNAQRALTNFWNEKVLIPWYALLKRTLSNDIPFIGQIKNVICLSGLVVVNIVTFGLISLIGKQRSNIEKVFNQHPSVKWHIVIAS